MKKFLLKVCAGMCLLAMFAAQVSASAICVWKAYQPKVPSALLDSETEE